MDQSHVTANHELPGNPLASEWLRAKAVRSRETAKLYRNSLRLVLASNPDGFLKLSKAEKEKILTDYVLSYSEKVSGATIQSRLAAVRSFCVWNEANDINWQKIRSVTPRARRAANDRPPALQEIRRLLAVCDARMRAVVLILATSGCRVGAIPDLRFGQMKIIEVEEGVGGIPTAAYSASSPGGSQVQSSGKKSIALLQIYAGTVEEYATFASSEALLAIRDYIRLRQASGEKITADSPLIRNDWNKGAYIGKNRGNASGIDDALPIGLHTLRTTLWKLWYVAGIRSPDRVDGRRKEFSCIHGFRKWFKTRLEASGMKTLTAEILVGHGSGINSSYYKPSVDELSKEYVRAMPFLAISPEQTIKNQYEEEKTAWNSKFNEVLKELESLKVAILGGALQASQAGKQVAAP